MKVTLFKLFWHWGVADDDGETVSSTICLDEEAARKEFAVVLSDADDVGVMSIRLYRTEIDMPTTPKDLVVLLLNTPCESSQDELIEEWESEFY